jgi:pyruvate/2-oxoglutarate dehydrogenase complex dihydrolipoamide acyltransferase (E2) component
LSPEESFEDHEDPGGEFAKADPDVLLDIQEVKVDDLSFEVDDLEVQVSLRTRLADLLDINVGVDVKLEGVKLEAKGVQAVAQLKARLENVQAIISRTLSSVDENPQILDSLTQMSETAARGRRDGSQRSLEGSRKEPAEEKAQSGQPEETQPADGETSKPETAAQERPRGRGKVTDAVRRRAEELGVDPSRVQGMGSRGRVLVSDVERAASEGSAVEG